MINFFAQNKRSFLGVSTFYSITHFQCHFTMDKIQWRPTIRFLWMETATKKVGNMNLGWNTLLRTSMSLPKALLSQWFSELPQMGYVLPQKSPGHSSTLSALSAVVWGLTISCESKGQCQLPSRGNSRSYLEIVKGHSCVIFWDNIP